MLKTAMSCGLVLALIASYSARAAADDLREVRLVQSFVLSSSVDGRTGRLELYRDRRLDEDAIHTIWGKSRHWEDSLSPQSALYRALAAAPVQTASLVLRDSAGRVVGRMEVENPFVMLEEMAVPSGRERVLLLSEDRSVGVGSYAGILTRPLQLGGKFGFAVARDSRTGEQEPVVLSRALKSGWRSCSTGTEIRICAVASAPSNQQDFRTTLRRYIKSGGSWFVQAKTIAGVWEEDTPFPEESQFP